MQQLPDRLVRLCKMKRRERIKQLEEICSLLIIEFEVDPLCIMETEDEDLAKAAQEYGFHVICEEYLDTGKWSISVPDLEIYDEEN